MSALVKKMREEGIVLKKFEAWKLGAILRNFREWPLGDDVKRVRLMGAAIHFEIE